MRAFIWNVTHAAFFKKKSNLFVKKNVNQRGSFHPLAMLLDR
jgi:hypothetical protein